MSVQEIDFGSVLKCSAVLCSTINGAAPGGGGGSVGPSLALSTLTVAQTGNISSISGDEATISTLAVSAGGSLSASTIQNVGLLEVGYNANLRMNGQWYMGDPSTVAIANFSFATNQPKVSAVGAPVSTNTFAIEAPGGAAAVSLQAADDGQFYIAAGPTWLNVANVSTASVVGLTVSSINNAQYPPAPTDSFSTLTVSTLVAIDVVSTQSLLVSSFNNAVPGATSLNIVGPINETTIAGVSTFQIGEGISTVVNHKYRWSCPGSIDSPSPNNFFHFGVQSDSPASLLYLDTVAPAAISYFSTGTARIYSGVFRAEAPYYKPVVVSDATVAGAPFTWNPSLQCFQGAGYAQTVEDLGVA